MKIKDVVRAKTIPSSPGAILIYAWIKFPENKVVQRSQEYVMAGLLTIMGVMIITIFLKLIWHSCRREMSHGRRAVRYQCPSRNDESNDYGEVRDNVVLIRNHKALESARTLGYILHET